MENINWGELGFAYMKTPYNVRCVYKNGKWGELEVSSSEYIDMHIAASCLHYGQEAFEGLKAFRGVDGKVRIFRLEDNAKRMIKSAEYLEMAQPSIELFSSAVLKAVEQNSEFIPPYESGASLYIRPVLIGTGAQVGVKPADEYTLIVFVTPVGPYFKGGEKFLKAVVYREFDRAGANGTGHVKAGGNYGSSMKSTVLAHKEGYDAVIYLDPREKTYIDECGAANFFGIKNNTYYTPESTSILPSITNMSLLQLAQDMGMKTERTKIALTDLPTFDECAACGTAAILTKIGRIDDPEMGVNYEFKPVQDSVCDKLYHAYRDIQYGRAVDKHNWITFVNNQ